MNQEAGRTFQYDSKGQSHKFIFNHNMYIVEMCINYSLQLIKFLQVATHTSSLAWRIPRADEPGGLQSMGLQKVKHNWETNTLTFHFSQEKKKLSIFCSYSNKLRLPCWDLLGLYLALHGLSFCGFFSKCLCCHQSYSWSLLKTCPPATLAGLSIHL